ncbi:MAG: hypothetical protein JST16_07925 [Bdellovibrionales bacterium]|nr:hypothetical protein [Bdellovibrionales bacterium]
MFRISALILFVFISAPRARATQANPALYRKIALSIPANYSLVHRSLTGDLPVSWSVTQMQPAQAEPTVFDTSSDDSDSVEFYDRILFGAGSKLTANGRVLPLTCLWVHGSHHSHAPQNQRILLRRLYLVASDTTCTGPVKPGLPPEGNPELNWDSYIYFEQATPALDAFHSAVLSFYGTAYPLQPAN